MTLWQSSNKNKKFIKELLTQLLAVLLGIPVTWACIMSCCKGCIHPGEGSLLMPTFRHIGTIYVLLSALEKLLRISLTLVYLKLEAKWKQAAKGFQEPLPRLNSQQEVRSGFVPLLHFQTLLVPLTVLT